MFRTLAMFAFAALLACSRPQPSPDYERARQLWTSLVQARGEAAAEDPRADEVLALLDRVPKESLDAPAAAELRGRIEAERKSHVEELARRQRLVAGAGEAPDMPAGSGAAAAEGPAEPGPPPARVPALVVGMKLDEFRASFGDCFDSKESVQLTSPDGGRPRAGQMWVMKDEEGCRGKYPQLAGQVVLFADGVLAGVSPAAAVKRVETVRPVELGTLPDGGLGERVDGGVVPLPEGARLLLDGGAR
jgi:hypothetical protein